MINPKLVARGHPSPRQTLHQPATSVDETRTEENSGHKAPRLRSVYRQSAIECDDASDEDIRNDQDVQTQISHPSDRMFEVVAIRSRKDGYIKRSQNPSKD